MVEVVTVKGGFDCIVLQAGIAVLPPQRLAAAGPYMLFTERLKLTIKLRGTAMLDWSLHLLNLAKYSGTDGSANFCDDVHKD